MGLRMKGEMGTLKLLDRRELTFLPALAYFVEARSVVEVGVQRGDAAVHLCRIAEANGGMYYGFDLWDQHGLLHQFDQSGSRESVESLLRNNGLRAFELFAMNTTRDRDAFRSTLDRVCPAGIDLAFIDACHSYLGVADDFFSVYPRLTKTGVVVLHDTVKIDGCREFVLDLRTKFWDGTYDVVDLPFGFGPRRCGVSLVVKRSFATLDLSIDESCGSPSLPGEIEVREAEWLAEEVRGKPTMPDRCTVAVRMGSVGMLPGRKKFS